MKPQTKGQFTGKHMLAVMVVGFGIVMAVNFTMASYAISGFHGVVVKNSYVASQNFNGWIDEARADAALGWDAKVKRSRDGHVTIATSGVPEGAVISAQLRRPIGAQEQASLTFIPTAEGAYRSTAVAAPGRWTVRLTIEAAGEDWAGESEIR